MVKWKVKTRQNSIIYTYVCEREREREREKEKRESIPKLGILHDLIY